MAVVTITISDDKGGLDITAESDPPFYGRDLYRKNSPAQRVGLDVLGALHQAGGQGDIASVGRNNDDEEFTQRVIDGKTGELKQERAARGSGRSK